MAAPASPRDRAWAIANGAALGVLGAFLLSDLGAAVLLGVPFPRFTFGWLLLGTGAVAAVVARRRARIVIAIDVLLFAVWLLVGWTPVLARPFAAWVRDDSLSASPADAAVVLSGGFSSGGRLNAESIDRLLYGLELVRAGTARRLITTRVVESVNGRRITSDGEQRALVVLGGELNAWTVLDSVATTRDEATRAAAMMPPAARRIIVVTSPLHTRRACATFEAVGFSVRCAAAPEHGADTWHPNSPSARFAALDLYLHEVLGVANYRARHWIGK